MDDKLVYSIDEIADQLSVGRTLVYRLIGSGELRSIKIGGRRLVTDGQLRALVASLENQAQP